MKMTKDGISVVSWGISNSSYHGNMEATTQLIELFDKVVDKLNNKITHRVLNAPEDYINMYDDNFYTYWTWEELVQSEIEQGEFGMTEEQCKEQLGKFIWQLPCGWYVQYV